MQFKERHLTLFGSERVFQEIRVKVDNYCRENDCLRNCLEKVRRDGGEVVVGWRKTTANSNISLIANLDHHAVWRSPDGELIDISPRVFLTNQGHKVVIDEISNFEPDPAARFTEDGRALPSRYIPMTEDKWGLLKRACESAAQAQSHRNASAIEKANYADEKVRQLLEKHLGRLRR